MSSDDLDGAWDAVRDALPEGWIVGRPAHQVEVPQRPWRVFAIDIRRLAEETEYVEATGRTAAESLRDLAGLLLACHPSGLTRR